MSSPSRTSPIGITGVGLVTSLGASVAETWPRLVRGERGVGPIDLFDTTGQRTVVGAQVRAIGRARDGTSRTTSMALVAAREAMQMAGLDVVRARVGLVVAGTTAGTFETEALLARFHADPGSRDVLPEMRAHPLSATADCMEAELGPFVRVRTLSSACSGGASALAVAALWLLAGDVDVVLAGGSDGLCRLTFTGFNALGANDPEPCRPFDRRRRGLTLGEGAGFMVLERTSAATHRGVRPIAELCGWAMGAEAHHITNPEASGSTPARLITAALARAGLDASQIDYVNAHGTGTPLNDPMESSALAKAFGPEIARVPVSSSKAQIGHTLGAAGAIEAVIAALTIARQFIPPTAGLDEPDPSCPLVHVPHEGRAARVRAVVSNSFGFGGMDAVLVLGEPGFAPGPVATKRQVVVTGAATLTPAPPDERVNFDAAPPLDIARARRLDRATRLGVVVAERARVRTLGSGAPPAATKTGVVLGNAFGSVEATAAFMHRLFEKGPRLASPADFPNLVPSSPVGHASIYMGLGGPALAVADLGASADSAVAQGFELVVSGEAECIIAGGFEESGDIVERTLAALFRHEPSRGPRREGASAVVLESDDAARARGATILARVEQVLAWRGDAPPDLQAALNAPKDAKLARVFVAREGADLDRSLSASQWHACARVSGDESLGEHDGLGGIAIAAGVEAIVRGEASEVLVMGVARGRGYAVVLGSP